MLVLSATEKDTQQISIELNETQRDEPSPLDLRTHKKRCESAGREEDGLAVAWLGWVAFGFAEFQLIGFERINTGRTK